MHHFSTYPDVLCTHYGSKAGSTHFVWRIWIVYKIIAILLITNLIVLFLKMCLLYKINHRLKKFRVSILNYVRVFILHYYGMEYEARHGCILILEAYLKFRWLTDRQNTSHTSMRELWKRKCYMLERESHGFFSRKKKSENHMVFVGENHAGRPLHPRCRTTTVSGSRGVITALLMSNTPQSRVGSAVSSSSL